MDSTAGGNTSPRVPVVEGGGGDTPPSPMPEVTVVVPTRNEAGNALGLGPPASPSACDRWSHRVLNDRMRYLWPALEYLS